MRGVRHLQAFGPPIHVTMQFGSRYEVRVDVRVAGNNKPNFARDALLTLEALRVVSSCVYIRSPLMPFWSLC